MATCKQCGKEADNAFAGQYCGECWYSLSLEDREQALTGRTGLFVLVLILSFIIALLATVFL